MNRVIENRRRGNDRSDILRSWPRRWKILIVKKISFHSFSIYIYIHILLKLLTSFLRNFIKFPMFKFTRRYHRGQGFNLAGFSKGFKKRENSFEEPASFFSRQTTSNSFLEFR